MSTKSHAVFALSCPKAWLSTPQSAHVPPLWRASTTQFKTPFCACCSGTAQICKQTGHQCSKMGGPQVEHWVRESTSCLHSFFDDVDALPPEMGLPRPAWVRLNRLQTGVSLFRSSMHKWGMVSTASCECGAEEQTADHTVL